MKKTMGIMIAAVLMLAAGTLLAQGPGAWGAGAGGPQMGPGQVQGEGFGMEQLARFRMMFRDLDLSEEQIEEIRDIVEGTREEARAILEAARPEEEQETFMDMFTSPTLTVRDLEEAMGRMDEVREEVRDLVFQAIVDVHDVLTPEQLEKLAEMAEEHPHGMGPGMGGPGMGRDPAPAGPSLHGIH